MFLTEINPYLVVKIRESTPNKISQNSRLSLSRDLAVVCIMHYVNRNKPLHVVQFFIVVVEL